MLQDFSNGPFSVAIAIISFFCGQVFEKMDKGGRLCFEGGSQIILFNMINVAMIELGHARKIGAGHKGFYFFEAQSSEISRSVRGEKLFQIKSPGDTGASF